MKTDVKRLSLLHEQINFNKKNLLVCFGLNILRLRRKSLIMTIQMKTFENLLVWDAVGFTEIFYN